MWRPRCAFRVEKLEKSAIISKVKTKVIECITERTTYNRYRLYMCVTANKKCVCVRGGEDVCKHGKFQLMRLRIEGLVAIVKIDQE